MRTAMTDWPINTPIRIGFGMQYLNASKEQVVDISLEHPDKSSRELARFIIDTQEYFISESSVYRILKVYDLITSPAYSVIAARDTFTRPTVRINELWQTDFSYFRIIHWGWYYLASVMDDYSRYSLSWKLFSTMSIEINRSELHTDK